MRNKKFIIGGLIICLALGYLSYLGYTLLQSSVEFYSSVSELKEKGEEIYDQTVQVKGEVIPDSIEFDTENLILFFSITDQQETLDVIYKGDKRNTLENQSQVVIEGEMDSTGIFHSSSILTKCPSKY